MVPFAIAMSPNSSDRDAPSPITATTREVLAPRCRTVDVTVAIRTPDPITSTFTERFGIVSVDTSRLPIVRLPSAKIWTDGAPGCKTNALSIARVFPRRSLATTCMSYACTTDGANGASSGVLHALGSTRTTPAPPSARARAVGSIDRLFTICHAAGGPSATPSDGRTLNVADAAS